MVLLVKQAGGNGISRIILATLWAPAYSPAHLLSSWDYRYATTPGYLLFREMVFKSLPGTPQIPRDLPTSAPKGKLGLSRHEPPRLPVQTIMRHEVVPMQNMFPRRFQDLTTYYESDTQQCFAALTE